MDVATYMSKLENMAIKLENLDKNLDEVVLKNSWKSTNREEGAIASLTTILHCKEAGQRTKKEAFQTTEKGRFKCNQGRSHSC